MFKFKSRFVFSNSVYVKLFKTSLTASLFNVTSFDLAELRLTELSIDIK